MNTYQYVGRIEELGGVTAVFYPNATNDETAKLHKAACEKSDPRQKCTALFRVHELTLEEKGGESCVTPCWYLCTGVTDKESKRLGEIFFVARSNDSARDFTKERRWLETKLYRCEQL